MKRLYWSFFFPKKRYEEKIQEQVGGIEKEDLSDMVAEHAARQKVSVCYRGSIASLSL